MLLQDVFGIKDPDDFIHFENPIKRDNTNFIDGYIDKTHVLIEQKSIGVDLRKGVRQSDGSILSPYQQAKRYAIELGYDKRARWIVLCNFKEFHIYDMNKMTGEPEVVLLSELEKDFYRLLFLVKEENVNIKKQTEVSLQAGELVGLLYDALLKQYQNPNDEEILKDLNILCVRLVFCFYAEDSGLFGKHNMFHDYLAKFQRAGFRNALARLFTVLDQKPEDRDPYLDDDLAAFPYVNGGLFEKENVVIPFINDEIVDIILNKASADFDWSMISPTIFGAVFESTLNPESRRAGGMHYTSIENIHKVIDPLFLNALHEEFEKINAIKVTDTRNNALSAFQKKLASLKFLDPAAGSGNFLTQTYLSLRRLENKVIDSLSRNQMFIGKIVNPIQVSISQFYGIEINDFAVTVARTALWIAESQMMRETEDIIHGDLIFLPLTSSANIVEGNALRMDWNEVVPSTELNYIMGNPPFVGKKEQSNSQKTDMKVVFGNKLAGIGKLDYVTAWYKKTVDYIKKKPILTAFVSTNSITQGEQVPVLWPVLLKSGLIIFFAYHSFVWNSQTSNMARVHCVIIGFSCLPLVREKVVYLNETQFRKAKNINPYLVDAPNIIVKSSAFSISNSTQIFYGSMPIDNGHLILDNNNLSELLRENPDNARFVRPYIGGNEIINNGKRWCLWLKGINPSEFRPSKFIMDRVKKNYDFRKNSTRKQTQILAETPTLFGEIRQPETRMLAIPKVSSEKRKYVPMTFVEPEIIVNGSALIIPSADLYMFGLLTSNVHMGWLASIGGRMEMRYQYSGTIVFNTFPWPTPTEAQKSRIEKSAQSILDARNLFPEASLADLYDDLTMPIELRTAHQNNDRAVMEAYGFNWRTMTESECVAELMKMYQKISKAD